MATTIVEYVISKSTEAPLPSGLSSCIVNTDSGFIDQHSSGQNLRRKPPVKSAVVSNDGQISPASSTSESRSETVSGYASDAAPSNGLNCKTQTPRIVSRYNPKYREESLKWLQKDEDGDNDLLISLSNLPGGKYQNIAELIIDNAPAAHFLDARNKSGMFPLMMASIKNQPAMIIRLRLAGANPNLEDFLGNTALHMAVRRNYFDCAYAVCRDLNEMELQAYYGRRRRNAVEYSVNMNKKNCDGKTALYIAVESSKLDLVKFLLDFGADPNLAENSSGRTPLHLAVEKVDLECCKLLLESRNTDVNVRNYPGRTALDLAMQTPNMSREVIDLLNENQATLGSPSNDSTCTSASAYDDTDS